MTPNKQYEKGRKAENECCQHLVMQGYIAKRSPGSKGPWDVVAVGPQNVKLVSVMREGTRDRESRRKKLQRVAVPPCVVKELWVKIPYRGWEIEVLDGP